MATSLYDREFTMHEDTRTLRWSAVFAGFVVALGTQVILVAIGTALGLTAALVGGSDDVSRGLGIGAGIWMVASPIISLFLGGMAAGYVARPESRTLGSFHGVLVWCLATVFGIWIASSIAGTALGSLTAAVGGTASATAEARADDPDFSVEGMQQEAGKQSERLRQTLHANRDELQRAGETAADVGTGVAWAAVLGMLISLGAAALGGLTGYRTPEHEEVVERRIVRDNIEPLHPTDLH